MTIATPSPDDFEIDEAFDEALKESAERLNVSVKYYIEEFLV